MELSNAMNSKTKHRYTPSVQLRAVIALKHLIMIKDFLHALIPHNYHDLTQFIYIFIFGILEYWSKDILEMQIYI
jgi:hypothetical protein